MKPMAESCHAAQAFDMVSWVATAAGRFFPGRQGSHNWDHTRRVVRLARRIGQMEGAEARVVEIAALLHDIGRSHETASGGTLCHAQKGAELAAEILQPLPLTPAQRDNILHCIRTHRYRGDAVPATLEARVLFDADKLDALGAVGVARAYLFAGEIGARLHNTDGIRIEDTAAYGPEDTGYREYQLKLRHLHLRMLTATGKQMARRRRAFMDAFFKRFLAEYQGEH